MAKVSLSALLDSLTGKLSGSVFQNSLGGIQIRQRVSPRNPRSPAQQGLRANFSYNGRSWSDLSQTQIESWNTAAPSGQSGISLFQSTNQMLFFSGLPPVDEYTGTGELTPPGVEIATLDENNFEISCPGIIGAIPVYTYLNIFATPNLSPGKTQVSISEYRYINTVAPGIVPSIQFSIYHQYVAVFGQPVDRSLIAVRCYLVNSVTGASSPSSFTQANVNAV